MFPRSKTRAQSIETKALKLPSLMLALEPRYVFDAALSAEILESAHEVSPVQPVAEGPSADEAARNLVAAAHQNDRDLPAGEAQSAADAQVGALVEALVTAHNLAPRGTEIAFIDSRLSDLPSLVGAIPEGVRIVLVDSGRDGVAAMVDALAGERDITGIHIISHGSPGSIQLGAATIDAGTMSGLYRDALQSLASRISQDADILVYGCNFGAGDAGEAATSLLAELTGADVASSDDLTGSAERGGDWELEVRHGVIAAGVVEAMRWNGVLDPFNISATTAPVVRDNTGAVVTAASTTIGGVTANRHITDPSKMVGATVVWANAGFVGGTPIDLRATVLSVIDTNPNAGHDPGLHFTISNGDDPSVRVDNAEVRIRWDAFQAGTYDPATGTGVVASGDVGFFIRDIDALGHIYSSPGVMSHFNMSGIKPQESVRADFDELSNYQTESLAATHLTVGLNIDPDTGAVVTNPAHSSFGKITATNLVDTEFAGPESGIKFNWNSVSAWEVTYRVAPPPGPVNLDLVPANGTIDATLAGASHGQRFFDHDGDGDLTFVAAHTVDMRHLDLDGNDSTLPGDDYQATYTEGGAAVPVVDGDVDITGLDTRVVSATVELTNPKPGDQLLVGGSTATSGTVNGLAYTISTAGGVITVQLTGSVTDPAIYETALKQISFSSTSSAPDTTDRVINVSFNNGTVDSNTAVATIQVVAVNDPPSIDLDGPLPVSNGTLPPSPPDNAWQVALYGGHFGVAGSADPASEAPSGAPGTPTLHGVGYSPSGSVVFNDTFITSAERPQDSLVASGFSYVANPVNGDYVPSNGIWTMVMSRTLTEDATISVGAPGEYFDDHAELFVNGTRVDAIIGWYPSLPAGEVISYAAQAGDVIEIRLTNVGNLGGFSVSLITAEQPNDLDHEVTFTEGDATVPVTLTTKADAADADDDIEMLSIAVGGVSDGASEIVRIGGASFNLSSSSSQVITVGGTALSVSYTTSGGFEITRSGGGAIPQEDLDTLLRGMTYENTSNDPTSGDRTLTFTATDSANVTSAPAVSTIHVLPVNDPPSGADSTITTAEDTARPFTAADFGFGDPDGHSFQSVTVNPLTGSGSLTYQGTPVTAATVIPAANIGQLIYTPAANANGSALASFTFQVTDTGGTANGGQDTDASPNTITLNVTPVNDGPVIIDPATGGPVSGDPNAIVPPQGGSDSAAITPLDVTAFFGDPDTTDTLTLSVDPAALPPGITFDPSSGTFSGTPAANASQGGPGGNGTYPVVVTATDPHGATVTTTVVFAITNPAPDAIDDALAGTENQVLTGSVLASNGAGADTDPDGDTLVVTEVNGVAANVGSGVAGSNGGTFTIDAAGGYTFDPGTAFDDLAAGETRTTSVTYTIDDGEGGTDTATVTVTVTGTNDGPIIIDPATGGPVSGDPNTIVPPQSGSDSAAITPLDVTPYFGDPDTTDTLTLSVDPAALPPGITFDPSSGTFSGTPAANASQGGPGGNGTYPVVVTATDPHGATVTTTVVFAITNPAPDAIDDALAGTENQVLTGSVLASNGAGADTDPDGDTLVVTEVNGVAANVGSGVAGSNGGTFTIDAAGGYTFDPGTAFDDLAAGETRTTSVTYTIDDGEGGTDTATIQVTVTGVNDAPVANHDTANTNYMQPVVVDLLANDTDVDSGPLTVVSASVPPSQGTLQNIGGVWTFTPAYGFAGVATITYTIADPEGAQSTSTHAVTVVPPVLIARDGGGVATFNKALSGTVAGNDTFVAGSSFTVVQGPASGRLVLRPDGTYTFTPKKNFSGVVTFQYEVRDPTGQTVRATERITVSTQLHACMVTFGKRKR